MFELLLLKTRKTLSSFELEEAFVFSRTERGPKARPFAPVAISLSEGRSDLRVAQEGARPIPNY